MVKNNFFKNKKILITGNTGFLGSWLTLALLEKQAKIYGISNSFHKNSLFNLLKLKNKIIFKKIDMKNHNKLKDYFKQKKFDIIVHLAAEPLVYKSLLFPKDAIDNNFITTLNLLDCIKKKNTIFINFTTDKVYQNSDNKKNLFSESDYIYGSDPYSFSKSCSDMLSEIWSKNFNYSIKYLNIRCGNIIGGFDWSEKRIVTDIISSLFGKKKLYLRQPKSIRPWIHVYEVINYLLHLIKNHKKIKNNFSIWNIAPDRKDAVSVNVLKNKFFGLKKGNNNSYYYKKENKLFEKKYLIISNKKLIDFLTGKFLFKLNKRVELTYNCYKQFFENRNEIKKFIKSEIKNYIS